MPRKSRMRARRSCSSTSMETASLSRDSYVRRDKVVRAVQAAQAVLAARMTGCPDDPGPPPDSNTD